MSAQPVSVESLTKDQMKTVSNCNLKLNICKLISKIVTLNFLFFFCQFSEFLLSYNKLSELCFADCVNDFTSRDVKAAEDRCALNCMEKYLKTNQRISQRFQEFQMLANENAMAMAQKSGQLPS